MRNLATISLLLFVTGCGAGSPDLSSVQQQMTPEQLDVGPPVSNSIEMILVPIPAGEFQMGLASPKDKNKTPAKSPAAPQHRVKISRPFYMSICEVTLQQFETIMGETPWKDQALVTDGPDHAASYVTWDMANEFCRRLSEVEGEVYRLPTEAEWEYACRAGSDKTWSFGDDGERLDDYAWYDANTYKAGRQYPQRVARKRPNMWSLYDMHGNVWEWCQDWYGPYDLKEAKDPAGPKTGRFRVWRGGSFASARQNTRSANRVSFNRPNYHPEYLAGFRVVRELKTTSEAAE